MPPRNPNFIVPTRPAGTSDNSAASTAFVTGALGSLPLGTSLQLITRGTVSAAATLDLNVDPAVIGTFQAFHLILSNFVPVTDNIVFQMRFGDSGGINSGAADYSWVAIWNRTFDGTESQDNDSNSDQIELMEAIDNDPTGGLSGTYWINGNLVGGQKNIVWGQGMCIDSADTSTSFLLSRAGGGRVTPIDLTTIQLLFSSGNIATGYYVLYGMNMTGT